MDEIPQIERLTPERLDEIAARQREIIQAPIGPDEIIEIMGTSIMLQLEIKALWSDAANPGGLLRTVREFEQRLAALVSEPIDLERIEGDK